MAAATASISLNTAFLGQTVVTAEREVVSRVQAATKKAATKKAVVADPELAKWYGKWCDEGKAGVNADEHPRQHNNRCISCVNYV